DSANATAVSLGLTGLTYSVGGGADESGQSLTVTIDAIPSFVELYLADGTTAVTAGSELSVAELQGLKVKTLADAVGTGTITWTVRDDGTTAGDPDAQTFGDSLSITVTEVNDAPTRTSAAPS